MNKQTFLEHELPFAIYWLENMDMDVYLRESDLTDLKSIQPKPILIHVFAGSTQEDLKRPITMSYTEENIQGGVTMEVMTKKRQHDWDSVLSFDIKMSQLAYDRIMREGQYDVRYEQTRRIKIVKK